MAVLIGIDYGAKRVGVAVSDERGAIAFPRATYPNDRTLLPAIIDLVHNENARAVVIGDSRNLKGKDNPITPEVQRFAASLQSAVAVPVHYEPEFYTSVEARRDTGKRAVDAEAAAILLNSYITRTSP